MQTRKLLLCLSFSLIAHQVSASELSQAINSLAPDNTVEQAEAENTVVNDAPQVVNAAIENAWPMPEGGLGNTLNPIAIKKVSEKRIKAAAAKIAAIRKWHSGINFSIKAAAPTIVVCYLLYLAHNWLSSDDTEAAPANVVKKAAAPQEGWGTWISKIPARTFDTVSDPAAWTNLAKVLGQWVAYGVVQKTLNDSALAVDHPHTINWFVHTRAKYDVKIKHMLMHAQDLESYQLAKTYTQEVVDADRAIVILANALVTDVENIAGFITTKIAQLPKDRQQHAREVMDRMVGLTNKFVVDAQVQRLLIARGSKAALVQVINLYKKNMAREIFLFSSLDHEKDYEDEIDLEKMRIIRQL